MPLTCVNRKSQVPRLRSAAEGPGMGLPDVRHGSPHRGEAFRDAPGRAAGRGLRGGYHHHPRKEARAGKGDDAARADELKAKRQPSRRSRPTMAGCSASCPCRPSRRGSCGSWASTRAERRTRRRKPSKEAKRRTKWSVLKGYHVLRHSFISALANKGIDQRIIDELVGHQTEAMRRRYRHLYPQTVADAIKQVFG